MAARGDNGILHGNTIPFATLPCICCGKELESVFAPDEDGKPLCENQPYAATTFHSYGHYGSTTFDPMDGSFIEINVCDDCLKERASIRRVAFKKINKPHSLPYKYWDVENDG